MVRPLYRHFIINKLLARFNDANLQRAFYAEYVHFADLDAQLDSDERPSATWLLKYGLPCRPRPDRPPDSGYAASWYHLTLVL